MLFGLTTNDMSLSDELQPTPIPDVFSKSASKPSEDMDGQATAKPAKSKVSGRATRGAQLQMFH